MKVYCGIDLHAKVSQVCVIDQDGEVLLNRQVKNVLAEILALLVPYGTGVLVAVNWYWLVPRDAQGWTTS